MGDQRYDDLVREMEENGGQASVDVTPKSTTQKISGAIKKATATVASALTIKPKVHKAPDPLALDNMPKKIGVDLCYQAGRLAESNGNPAAAIKQYERGLEDQPKHLPTLISLARLYDRQDEFDKAEKLYRRALEAEPQNAMAHNDLGLCLARHNQAEPALAELRQAVKLEPNRKLYRNNLATVLVDLGRIDEAWSELSTAHPAAVAHYNLGYLLYHAGNKPRATRNSRWPNRRTRPWSLPSRCSTTQCGDAARREDRGGDGTDQSAVPHRGPRTAAHRWTNARRRIRWPPSIRHRNCGGRHRPTRRPSLAATAPVAEPVPLAPANAEHPPNDAARRPTVQPPPSSEFPIRAMSGTEVEETDELELPTPALLDGSGVRPAIRHRSAPPAKPASR